MELWKPMFGYETSHEISNMGNVRSITRSVERSNGRMLNLKGRPLKSFVDNRGYLLIKPNNKSERIHRLVALTFIPNPEGKRDVNHINGDKLVNTVDNLEWATPKENKQHAIRLGLSDFSGMLMYNEQKKKRVHMLDLEGNQLHTFDSVSDAARAVSGTTSPLAKACKGRIKTYKGYKWTYAELE